MRPLALILVAAGCASPTNPCRGQSGVCLAVEVEGSISPPLDEIDVSVQPASGPALSGRLNAAAPIILPLQFAALLPDGTSGAELVRVVGARQGQAVAYGDASVTVLPSGQRVIVVLHALAGEADGGAFDLAAVGEDLAMTDLACAAGTHLCSGQCASNTSVSSCGTSCTTCASPANAIAICDGTQCGFTCANGFMLSGNDCVPVWMLQTSGTPQTLNDVWGSGSGDVYVVGGGGTLLHSVNGGTTWTAPTLPAGVLADSFNGVWGSGSGDVYVTGGSAILHSVDGGTTWTAQVVPASVASYSFGRVWGSGRDDVYVVGFAAGGVGNTILHSVDSGTTWTVQAVPASVGTNVLYRIWGSGSGDVYIVGGGTILHSVDSGTTWTALAVPPSMAEDALFGMWGSGSSDLYVVGYGGVDDAGAIFHSVDSGTTWTPQAVPPTAIIEELYCVWGSGSGDVYVSSAGGRILHSVDHGATWTVQIIGVTGFVADLVSVWGSGSGDVYAVGEGGVIVHDNP